MSTPTRRGALLVIEGLDRAGKSTQHALLCARLEAAGHRVRRMRFPDRSTSVGQLIDAYLRGTTDKEDHVIHLLFSANRWEAAAGMRAAVAAGETVVVDRYYYSGIVYSAAKGTEGLSAGWAREAEVGLPRPDGVVFLEIGEEEAERRGGFGEEKYETREMQGRVRRGFRELMAGGEEGEDAVVVDAGRGREEVEGEVWRVVREVMERELLEKPLRTVR